MIGWCSPAMPSFSTGQGTAQGFARRPLKKCRHGIKAVEEDEITKEAPASGSSGSVAESLSPEPPQVKNAKDIGLSVGDSLRRL